MYMYMMKRLDTLESCEKPAATGCTCRKGVKNEGQKMSV